MASSLSANTVFVYSSVNNVYGIDLTTQQETFLTSASLSPTVNALAANYDHGIIYYGDSTSIYYWDPGLGLGGNAHALINNFENGVIQAPIRNINSTGGSYTDGKYYVGSETDNGFIEDIFEVTMSADGKQAVSVRALDIHAACNCTEVQLGGFGDIAVRTEGGAAVIYGSSADLTGTGQGTHAGIWRFNLSANTWTLLGPHNGGQIANTLDNNIYTNVGNSIRQVNPATGAISGTSSMNTSAAIWDFTGGFSYDFGDAPDSYGAAIHLVQSNTPSNTAYLGNVQPDNEIYTLHGGAGGVDGRGDDQYGQDDEDALSGLLSIDSNISAYDISIECGDGSVAAWIDFDLNGQFDLAERNSNYPALCQSGSVQLTWTNVNISNAGDSYIRIRSSSNGSAIYKPTGFVKDGEVEDHEVQFTGGAQTAGNCPAGSVSHVYYANDLPKSWSGNITNPTVSTITIPDSLVATDVNLLDLQTTQRYQYLVRFSLNRAGNSAYLYGHTCYYNRNLDVSFDDEANGGVPCYPPSGGTYQPYQSLSLFDGADAQGIWELHVNSDYRYNNGTVRNWGLEICALDTSNAEPEIRVGKSADVSGRDVTINLVVENVGNKPLSNVELKDDLDATFGAGNHSIISAPQIQSSPAGFSANASYTGSTGSDQLLTGNGVLAAGEQIVLSFTVRVGFGQAGGVESYENQAYTQAVDDNGQSVADESGSGLDLSIDNDDPTVISISTGIVISGVVFEDSSTDTQTSHDGVQQAQEPGLQGRTVRIYDVATATEIGTVVTGLDGQWQYAVDAAYLGQELEVVVSPSASTLFVSESPLVSSANVSDGKRQLSVQADPDLNVSYIGVIQQPVFETDQSETVLAGTSVLYPHEYSAKTHGTVEFSLSTSNSNPADNWGETLYHDLNCNGSVDGADYMIVSAMSVVRDQLVCLLAQVDSPAGGLPGAFQEMKIVSTLFVSDPAATGHGVQTVHANIDTTTIKAAGDDKLVLKKSVRNITLGGLPVTQNSALPGHVLEYTIDYVNSGNGQIADLVINDEAPAFTQIQQSSAQCVQTPAPMGCTPAVSGSMINWAFQGELAPGDGGSVQYRVSID